jgi:hypothetical protein
MDFVFNTSKGRVVELYNRVKNADPTAARLYVIPVDVGAVTDATLKDCETFAAVVAAGVTERNLNGWNRKTLAAVDLAATAPDHVNDRMTVDVGNQTWTSVTADPTTDLIFCYSSVATPTDADLVPLTCHDFPITPDGSDVMAGIVDFFHAS